MAELFTCTICGEIFEKDRSDIDALKEVNELFPSSMDEPIEIVCEDCHNDFIKWMTHKYGPPPWPRRPPGMENEPLPI